TPLPGGLADDQRPLAGLRNDKQRVFTGRHFGSPDSKIAVRHETGRLMRPGTPHLIEGKNAAENLAPLCSRTGIIHRHGFSSGELTLRLCRWARPAGLVLPPSGYYHD